MDALSALHTRSSVGKVNGTLPDDEAINNLFKAALRAPDHGQLRPWRFLRIEGASLQRLADLFATAAKQDNPDLSAEEQQSAGSKALRAPLIIVSISRAAPHAKIPVLEQDLSAGAATHAMLVAAHAQGLGAVWRTGPMASHPVVTEALGLSENEKIIGFLYIGLPEGSARPLRELAIDDFVKRW